MTQATQREPSDLEKQGLIQSFEFCHELAWNTLKDLLEFQGITGMLGSRGVIREAFSRGLISHGDDWIDMTPETQFGLTEEAIRQITRSLKGTRGVERARVFGSRALGNFRDGSDIDIAIDAPDFDHSRFLRACSTLDDLMMPHKIDLVVMHMIENPSLVEHINRVGIDLW